MVQGLKEEVRFADAALSRFVFWEGKLYALPASLSDAVLRFGLLSWPGKIRAGLGAIGTANFSSHAIVI